MSADFPTLAETLSVHRWLPQDLACQCDPSRKIPWADHYRHVDEVRTEACTIRTAEQLDALPDRSAVFAANDAAWLKDSGWSPDEPWWVTGSSIESPSADIALPALLIRHPDWAHS